mmetsp:Transcript_32485/g.95752  ORF Transcript_32485/g.95752 Transcript_32485/m.95752 type:complete len:230 (+) Transcript_32485:515-1204(+)
MDRMDELPRDGMAEHVFVFGDVAPIPILRGEFDGIPGGIAVQLGTGRPHLLAGDGRIFGTFGNWLDLHVVVDADSTAGLLLPGRCRRLGTAALKGEGAGVASAEGACGVAVKSSDGGRHSVLARVHGRAGAARGLVGAAAAGRRGIRQTRAGRPSVGRADTADSSSTRGGGCLGTRDVMCRKSLPHLLEHVLRLGHEVVDVAEEELVVGLAFVVISVVVVVVAFRAINR